MTVAGGVVCLPVDVDRRGDLVTVVSFASAGPSDRLKLPHLTSNKAFPIKGILLGHSKCD